MLEEEDIKWTEKEQSMNGYKNPQTYVEGKGEVYCSMRTSTSFKCPRHQNGFKFPGKKKCKGCPYARYKK